MKERLMLTKWFNAAIEKIFLFFCKNTKRFQILVFIESIEPFINGLVLIGIGATIEQRLGTTIQEAYINRTAEDIKFMVFTVTLLLAIGCLLRHISVRLCSYMETENLDLINESQANIVNLCIAIISCISLGLTMLNKYNYIITRNLFLFMRCLKQSTKNER